MSYSDESGTTSHVLNIAGISHTYKYLKFSTRYKFEVRTRFKDNVLGEPVQVFKTTEPFSAPVGHLTAKVYANNIVTLSWSAPLTIDLKKNLKVKKPVVWSFCVWFIRICVTVLLAIVNSNSLSEKLYFIKVRAC